MNYAKHFSVEEAQAKLQAILPEILRMRELKKLIDAKGYDVYRHQYFGGIGPNGQKAFPLELEDLVAIVQKLNVEGVEVKDLNAGLIDFPHLRADGEEVFLCFRVGEEKIVAWHPIEGGFNARKPLTDL